MTLALNLSVIIAILEKEWRYKKKKLCRNEERDPSLRLPGPLVSSCSQAFLPYRTITCSCIYIPAHRPMNIKASARKELRSGRDGRRGKLWCPIIYSSRGNPRLPMTFAGGGARIMEAERQEAENVQRSGYG
ncbi:hypothetical protein Pcinc_025792 [Petrolisthes cinctipes]|uniref:Uncharacterized protein n=1 Tax=Petrolisthes cinctipes TaxID=88211 RepID=A0AAE1F788_PETCI|nr:hypothetical protein Pcinc_025792 [Petrolisthes cinctipes]